MYHKTITLKADKRRRIRLHSIDGRIWCSQSPRYAATIELLYFARRHGEYESLRRALAKRLSEQT